MKNFAFALAALTCAALGQAPTPVTMKNVKLEKILPAIIGTPEFTVTQTVQKRSLPQKWMEIEVEFAIEGVEIVDELTFKFDVLINGKLFPGEVTLVNIPKGKERYTVMYISPRNLDRITAGKQLTASMIENVWVTITKQGQALAAMSIKDKTGRLPVPNAQQFQGMLLPKSETPFSVLWTDRYEAVKTQTR